MTRFDWFLAGVGAFFLLAIIYLTAFMLPRFIIAYNTCLERGWRTAQVDFLGKQYCESRLYQTDVIVSLKAVLEEKKMEEAAERKYEEEMRNKK